MIYLATGVWRHYIFDVEMFTHINLTTAQSYTTGEIVNGSNSGATGVVQSISATTTATPNNITIATTGVVEFKHTHGFKDGQQVITGGNFSVSSSSSAYTEGVYVVRNATANNFELFEADGITAVHVSAFTTGPSIVIRSRK